MDRTSQGALEQWLEDRPTCEVCDNFMPSVEGRGLCEVAIVEDLTLDYKELSTGEVEVDKDDLCSGFEPTGSTFEEDEEKWPA